MRLADAAVDALATYRLTKLVLDDEITAPARDWVFERCDPQTTRLGYLLTCPWCVSVWAGGAVQLLRLASPRAADFTSGLLAASAVTGVLYERVG